MEWNQSSLPYDIVLNIVYLLEIEEVCSLSCCSRFWRDVCASDSLWIFLYRERWPSQSLTGNSHHSQYSSIEGWRSFYIKRHNEMDDRATSIIKVINQCSKSESVEVGDYQKAIADLHAMELGFKDIVLFLFAAKQNALLNLVGLHYLVFSLGVPVDYVVEALRSCHISDRQVCIKWWKLGRWLYGYRLRDECHTRKVSLADIVLAKEDEVLGVLQRGALHEVLRVQISVPGTYIPWTSQNVHTTG